MNAEWISTSSAKVHRSLRKMLLVGCALSLASCAARPPLQQKIQEGPPPTAMRAMREQPMTAPPQAEQYEARVPEAKPSAVVKVHFGTNRLQDPDASSRQGPPFFTSRDAGRLTYGTLRVTIDANHVVGEIKNSVHLNEAPVILQERAFLQQLRADLAGHSGRKLLVFVHGYNVTFENAAKRTAQIKHDLPFDGEAAFFSWPSRGNLLGYWSDESAVRDAEKYLEEFLIKLARESNAQNIYIIAHSMGNRAFTAVYPRVRAALQGRATIREIMLAAPDIDARVFRESIAPAMIAPSGTTTTLYSSGRDKALWGSWLVHGFSRRAGQQVLEMDGLESVDASTTDTSKLGMGHSYYAEQRGLLTDLLGIMNGRRPPQRTETLETMPSHHASWLLRKVPLAR